MDGINLNNPMFVSAGDNGNGRIDDLRIKTLKSHLDSNARSFLEYWLPGGKFVGTEYVTGDLHGDVGKKPGKGSTRISVAAGRVGVGSDFATGDRTGDLIDVYMKSSGSSFVETMRVLEEWAGISDSNPSHTYHQLPDIPEELIADPGAHVVDTISYAYMDYDENLILTIDRVVKSDGTKEFYPTKFDGTKTLPVDNRPLYNLPGLSDATTVILVEGEKCANTLIAMGYPATTCIGGSNAPLDKTDWSPLIGSHVILWPDNDVAGMKFMEAVAAMLSDMEVASISVVTIPAGKSSRWDVADATEEECERLISDTKEIYRDLDITTHEFSGRSYDDNPVGERFLLEGGFSMGSCSMLAAEGGTGKSMLYLCLKVAYGLPLFDQSFGARVMEAGNAVFLTAEDTRNDIHNRIATLDKTGKRHTQLKYDLKVIPMLSLGSTFPLLYVKNGELIEHPMWIKIREQLLQMKNLKLIALDPMSMLVHADITSDPSVASLVCAQFNRLAVETGASVLISHHFSKGDYEAHIETAEQARKYVRGTTGLVDSVRNTYCLWKAPPSIAKGICDKAGIDYEPGIIYFGATVKSNYKTVNHKRVFRRSEVTGLLECINTNYDADKDPTSRESVSRQVVSWISGKASENKPFSVFGGEEGIENNLRFCPHKEVTDYFRERTETLSQMVDNLVIDGVLGLYSGLDIDGLPGRGTKYLDVKGGTLESLAMGPQDEDENED